MPAEPGWWADTVGEHFSDWLRASPLLAQLDWPDEARGWAVARCSTGERLRLALVRALVLSPRVLLLDEPTAALDAASVSAVENIVRERLGTGMSALWVTHDAPRPGGWRAGYDGRRRRGAGGYPMNGYIDLSYWDVAFASVFVLINAALSLALDLNIHRRMLIAAARMVVQLAIMGLVLVVCSEQSRPI